MTDEEKDQVRALVAKGMSVPDIAKAMGADGAPFNQQRIYRFIKKDGLTLPRLRGRLPEDITDIHRKVAELGSVDAAATHYGVTRAAVYFRISKARQEAEPQ